MSPSRTRHRLSAHFVIEEFDSRDGARVPPRHEGAVALLAEWWLEPLRARFGAVTVHSGFRSLAHNLAVNGSPHSVHMLTTSLPEHEGRTMRAAAAADVVCATGSPSGWAAWATEHRRRHDHLAERGRGGIGHYASFIHLDTARLRSWRL